MMKTLLFWPFIIWIIHKCLASTLPSNEEMELSSSISLASQNRVKRDFDYGKYKVKCQQSGTGLFSFFAVPILLGDVTLDFMNMISVTVSISASASAPAATVMNTNKNTNKNTNSNGKKRKKRRLRDLDWVLESFLENPSNASTINQYEKQAKTHLDAYMKHLLNDPDIKYNRNNLDIPELIGERHSSKKDARKVPIKVATHFFGQLLDSFHEFKEYCASNKESEDCAVLENDNAVIMDALNEYEVLFNKKETFSEPENLSKKQDAMYDKALGL